VAVDFVDAGVSRPAAVAQALRRADLALLAVEDAPEVPALPHHETLPPEEETLAAIGLPLNTPVWQESYGSRALNVRRLSDILPPAARQSVPAVGSPEIELESFRLTAVVKPGSSGGPVIDRAGRVVGVVDGGLDGGASALNWAVPATVLSELLASADSGAGLGAAARELFAYAEGGEAPATVNESFFCGGREYFLLATRTLEEIAGSVYDPGALDDPNGFLAVLANFAVYMDESALAALRFALWVDAASGATVAVPEGMTLSEQYGFCVAETEAADVGVIFRNVDLDPAWPDAQSASLGFETDVVGLLQASCAPDANWSQLLPHTRFDGLVARRQGYYCDFAGGAIPGYGMVGHFTRAASYAAVAAFHMEFGRLDFDPAAQRAWAGAALAVLISTYQI
jgi:hypothetical protein